MQNGHLGFVLSKTREGKYHDFCDLIVFEKIVFKIFLSTLKRKAGFVFVRSSVDSRLNWRIKLHFQNHLA